MNEKRPSPPYIELLDRIHRHLRPRTYLEVGVSTGRSFSLALPCTRALGIDRAYGLHYPAPEQATIVRTTSDDFFAKSDAARLLGGPVDLAFIDGMHLFEHSLRDFANVERVAHPGSVVFLHDCNPVDERSAARERSTTFWSGDVWRSVAVLRRVRPDLDVTTFDIGPTGLGMVRGLDPHNRVLIDSFDAVVEEAKQLPFPGDEAARKVTLNLKPGSWTTVSDLLPDAFQPGDSARLAAERDARRLPLASAARRTLSDLKASRRRRV